MQLLATSTFILAGFIIKHDAKCNTVLTYQIVSHRRKNKTKKQFSLHHLNSFYEKAMPVNGKKRLTSDEVSCFSR